jgi:hypothetical protein
MIVEHSEINENQTNEMKYVPFPICIKSEEKTNIKKFIAVYACIYIISFIVSFYLKKTDTLPRTYQTTFLINKNLD